MRGRVMCGQMIVGKLMRGAEKAGSEICGCFGQIKRGS